MDAAIKAELERIGSNLNRIGEIETQIKTLTEQNAGTAELKAEVNKLASDNAAGLESVKALNERQDAFEIKALERLGRGTAEVKTAGQTLTEDDAFKSADRTNFTAGVRIDREALKAVTVSSNQNPPNYTGEMVRPQNTSLSMRDLIPGGRSARDVVRYVRMTGRATNAAVVAAGAMKPESNLAFADADATMIKLAHYIAVTEEQLSDIDGLQSIIDAELAYGIEKVEDAEFLNGPGGAGRLSGLVTQATAYDAATYGTTVTAAQRLDHVRGMIAQLQVADYSPDGIVLNPIDWFKIETIKTTDGAYIFANPQGVATPNLWGLPVAVTTQIAADSALVGAFQIGAQIFDGQIQGQYGIVMKTGQPNDFFLTNRYAVLAEERVTLAVKRPGAFVKGDLTPA